MSWEEITSQRGLASSRPIGWYVGVTKTGVRIMPPRDHQILKSARVRSFQGRGEHAGWMLIQPCLAPLGRVINKTKKQAPYVHFSTLPGLDKDYRLAPVLVEVVDDREGGARILLPWSEKRAESAKVIHQDANSVVVQTPVDVVVLIDPARVERPDPPAQQDLVETHDRVSIDPEKLFGGAAGSVSVAGDGKVSVATAAAPSPKLPSHARAAASFVKKKATKVTEAERHISDSAQVEEFLRTQGARREMSLEQAAEYLRHHGHKCLIEVGRPGKTAAHTTWREHPQIVLDDRIIDAQALFDVVNQHRAQADLPPIDAPRQAQGEAAA